MNTLITIRNAAEALLCAGLYNEIQGLELLNWGEGDSPVRGELVNKTSIGETIITEWKVDGIVCIHIHPYGWFRVA
jgi:hypothetical protein